MGKIPEDDPETKCFGISGEDLKRIEALCDSLHTDMKSLLSAGLVLIGTLHEYAQEGYTEVQAVRMSDKTCKLLRVDVLDPGSENEEL